MSNQSSPHRIEMHVIQLLVLFLPAPHVEVVEPSLPKRAAFLRGRFVPQTHLSGRSALSRPPAVQGSRNSLLQNLHHRRRSSSSRLSHQQMNVLRHHHITDQRKVIAFPSPSQNLKEKTPRTLGSQQRLAPIATASDEVQVTQPVPAFESVHHLKHPRTLRKRREECGTHEVGSNL